MRAQGSVPLIKFIRIFSVSESHSSLYFDEMHITDEITRILLRFRMDKQRD